MVITSSATDVGRICPSGRIRLPFGILRSCFCCGDGLGQGRELVVPEVQEDELALRFDQLSWNSLESISFRFFFATSQIN